MRETIYVTKPVLPPLEDFVSSLKKIWDKKILTNGGPFHQEFEKELADYLGVKHLSLFANGTLALVTALQALKISGEVITTPFSFVATTHSIWWNGIKPVFADIDPQSLNLDPQKVEAAITPQTTAIMPVHVYGNPCDVHALKEIADAYGLKLIYDAAHAFGVQTEGQSLLNFGDLSILSFHATRVFNTIEGGALICHDEATKRRVDFLKNFGYSGETRVVAPGINAKMNEMLAAFGLLQLQSIEEQIEKRKRIFEVYKQRIQSISGLRLHGCEEGVKANYAYCPILIDQEVYGKSRNWLYDELKKKGVHGRMYFFPLISSFNTYSGLASASRENLPVANQVAESVLCLPLFPDLPLDDIHYICDLLEKFGGKGG